MAGDRREQVERWLPWIVGTVALLSVVPFAYYMGSHRGERILSWVRDIGVSETDEVDALRDAAGTLGYGAIGIGAMLFAGAMLLRRRATTRLLMFTVVGWSLLFVACAAGGAFAVAGLEENTSDVAQRFIDQPGWIALAVPGFVVAVVSSQVLHERARGLRAGVSVRQWLHPPRVPPAAHELGIRQGLRSFARAVVLEAGFLIVLLVESFTSDEPTDYTELFGSRLYGVTLVPAIYAGVFLLLFAALPATRWISRDALRHPLTITSLGLIGIAFVLAAANVSLWISGTVIVVGGLIGSITGLFVQDLGPQPILGLVFIAFMYAAALHDGSEWALPSTAFGWLILVLLTGYAVVEIRRHWRSVHPAPASH